jgi:ATP/maltotriose-dependent transcriptional regulator MalT
MGEGRDDARQRGNALLEQRRFADARAAYLEVLALEDDADVWANLAAVHRALDDVPAAVAALERAYSLHLAAGRPGRAGAVACTLADVELTESGAAAVAAGWLSRARRHLRSVPDDPGHALLESLSAYLALAYDKDPARARACAERAAEHARRCGDGTTEVMTQAFLGLIEVSAGHLRDGFELLDGGTAAALAGEVDTLTALDVYCMLLTACERVRDFDRVDQWARRVLDVATEAGSDAFATFARTQYANLLIWRGRWPEAERELDRILVDAANRPLTAAMGMLLRASLRRRQGRLDDALAELARAEVEPFRRAVRHSVLTARARVQLDRGDPQAAADLAERYLAAVSTEDRIERIDALEILVRARLRLGEGGPATAAQRELEACAEAIPTDGVRGSVRLCGALVAFSLDQTDVATRSVQEAVDLFQAAGLPHEEASARLEAVDVHRSAGRVDRARREAEAACELATALGAAAERARAERYLASLRPGRSDAGDLTDREAQILQLIAEGRSNGQIADTLYLSIRTVERHVSNIYLKVGVTGPSARTAAVARAHSHQQV